MSSYYHTRSSSVAPSHPHAAFCVQPSLNSGPIVRKCTLVMSSPRSFVADCHAEKSLSDICAAIRHHILDQVTCAADPLASAKQHVISDVRPYSTPPYNVRGTKRHTDQSAQWAPHHKKPRSSVLKTSDETSDSTSAPQQTPLLSKIDYDNISEAIMSFTATRQQDKNLYVSKMKLRDALYDIIKSVFPYCGLYVIGSSMNGFGSSSSDMDLCLMLSHAEIDQKNEAMDILRILHKPLSKCQFLQSLRLIHARVPILKFTDKVSGIECDLNINNSVGIRNTHLLNAYSCLDWRLSPLVQFVKHWAKVQGINDASQGTVSSYSLVLMVVHYLQCVEPQFLPVACQSPVSDSRGMVCVVVACKPAVLPVLQQKYPHRFNATQDVRALTLNRQLAPYTSPNRDCLGQLFVGFLHYFAHDFKFETDVISVRLGRPVSREELLSEQSTATDSAKCSAAAAAQWKFLCIEEPFSLSNTAYSVHDAQSFDRITRVFQRSSDVIKENGNIKQITTRSLVPF